MQTKSSLRIITVTLALGFVLGAANAYAQAANNDEGLAIVKQNDCFQCHRVPTKLIGPAYKDVAAKYKGADDAKIEELAKKVIAGGTGNWGTVAMRAHPNLSLDDAKKAVKWVLSLSDASAASTAPGVTTAPAATTAPSATTAPAVTTTSTVTTTTAPAPTK